MHCSVRPQVMASPGAAREGRVGRRTRARRRPGARAERKSRFEAFFQLCYALLSFGTVREKRDYEMHGWHVNAKDIFNYGLDKPSNTINKLGSNVRAVNMNTIPGLNTLDISTACIDFGPHGLNPPHTHPRATEIRTVLEGEFYGDVLVFSQGLVHFQFNRGHTRVDAIAVVSSQNPGTITIANVVFGSKTPISDEVLAKSLRVDQKTVNRHQAQFWMDNNN
ncbi:hypothetical protein ZIOFF_046872 [Zingiber officinale]|uniref:Germin-like protein n=1 Tax=Zingiber officinale TaxID=94328 RepID=A0A8J5FW87_ZINOF|nr:hypothetical protein ZIOFF_046872 [Zingiber officinale]